MASLQEENLFYKPLLVATEPGAQTISVGPLGRKDTGGLRDIWVPTEMPRLCQGRRHLLRVDSLQGQSLVSFWQLGTHFFQWLQCPFREILLHQVPSHRQAGESWSPVGLAPGPGQGAQSRSSIVNLPGVTRLRSALSGRGRWGPEGTCYGEVEELQGQREGQRRTDSEAHTRQVWRERHTEIQREKDGDRERHKQIQRQKKERRKGTREMDREAVRLRRKRERTAGRESIRWRDRKR